MSQTHLDALLSDTASTVDHLTNLSESFKAVESQTSNFQKQCEGLLLAQKHDMVLADGIETNLQFYDFLDPASKKLNAPHAGQHVRGKEFSDLLRHLDECLDYMEIHVSYFYPFLFFFFFFFFFLKLTSLPADRTKRSRSLPF